jgi:hypothetical protein
VKQRLALARATLPVAAETREAELRDMATCGAPPADLPFIID